MRAMRALASFAVAGALFLGGAGAALGQESLLDGLRAAARGAPADAAAALAYGRALRRAGHEGDASQELRRAASLPSGKTGGLPIAIQWELARTAISRRDFHGALAACRSLGALPAGAADGHACAAEAHLLWRRASEALVETSQALANGNRSYEAKVA